ncbi:hydroxysqualene dehydroxylase HpnE [Aquabacterium humicola]|uniref:hydroxysqualene dehydroxylase HpnE n=1 Tax=Aquabacterium humicola TaxID=3237377 RepID=UPI002543DE02|nr:hydroxysqualene dehydroxylase HpnE [Rubrivivax pictus]
MSGRSVAVVGAGWAGLAAAVRAVEQGHRVTLLEMARQPGGRARGVMTAAGELDNGQHILIGAYRHTLALMRTVGADPAQRLHRLPLVLRYPDGRGLALPPGPAITSFVRGVAGAQGWSVRDRLALLAAAGGWLARGFRCAPELTVATLCRRLPAAVIADLVEPLCVAALNTPMAAASATVFLRVLKDALFSGAGSADLLLPRASLSDLLPRPALAWLASRGATLQVGRRAMALQADGAAWSLDGMSCDAVVLACSAVEAARLTASVAPAWSAAAAALRYEPIVTAYLHDPALRLPSPMMALAAGPQAPAQFVFDLGALGRGAACFAFVVSGAAPWVARGLDATAASVVQQARASFPGSFRAADDTVLRHIAAEQRATFACTPGLRRPPIAIAPGLAAAGDYVEGPYPATLEGAVRAGEQAVDAVL